MAFELNPNETTRLEASITTVLRAFAAGAVNEAQTVEFVRRLVDSAAIDNHTALEDWLFPERVAQWVKDCEGG